MLSLPLPLLLTIITLAASQQTNTTTSCPFDFTLLSEFTPPTDTPSRCTFAINSLGLLSASHLRNTSHFLPPASSSAACFSGLRGLFPSSFDPLADCSISPSSLSHGCMGIGTRADLAATVPASALREINRTCGQPLADYSTCNSCTTTLSLFKAAYLIGHDNDSHVFGCNVYPFIYAAAITPLGPADPGTAQCLFFLSPSLPSPSPSPPPWIFSVTSVTAVFLLVGFATVILLHSRKKKSKPRDHETGTEHLDSMAALIKFSFDEIKAATGNFSRGNIIGRGAYGNVYRGALLDGTEVAVKRFKNCSVVGDLGFAHEVEVIASIRHVNLVALRGYCTATTALEGHQRIIVCDLVRNGSLHDHLFGPAGNAKLTWPVRQRIAIGMARGLAYLHFGSQPAIIHRDIKASNILLDERFEAKVADFGLAKFSPEGSTHVSTRVVGTLGHVAPEYAMYGKLTARSDVYSFGVVLLELLSGKKAFTSMGEGHVFVLTDWAWSLVLKGKALDVIEVGTEELGPKEVLEKYVLIGVLSCHPQLLARPTMDQIVKMLETDAAVPPIQDRPISFLADMDEIEESVSSSSSGQICTFAGYLPFTAGNG